MYDPDALIILWQ